MPDVDDVRTELLEYLGESSINAPPAVAVSTVRDVHDPQLDAGVVSVEL